MENNKNNNSSNSLVFGRWPQTKITFQIKMSKTSAATNKLIEPHWLPTFSTLGWEHESLREVRLSHWAEFGSGFLFTRTDFMERHYP